MVLLSFIQQKEERSKEKKVSEIRRNGKNTPPTPFWPKHAAMPKKYNSHFPCLATYASLCQIDCSDWIQKHCPSPSCSDGHINANRLPPSLEGSRTAPSLVGAGRRSRGQGPLLGRPHGTVMISLALDLGPGSPFCGSTGWCRGCGPAVQGRHVPSLNVAGVDGRVVVH